MSQNGNGVGKQVHPVWLKLGLTSESLREIFDSCLPPLMGLSEAQVRAVDRVLGRTVAWVAIDEIQNVEGSWDTCQRRRQSK